MSMLTLSHSLLEQDPLNHVPFGTGAPFGAPSLFGDKKYCLSNVFINLLERPLRLECFSVCDHEREQRHCSLHDPEVAK
jgi:hypothetical protein